MPSIRFYVLITIATWMSLSVSAFAEDSEADLLKALTDKNASPQQQTAFSKLFKTKLSANAQTEVAEYFVGELTGEAGSLVNIAQVTAVLIKFKEIPQDKKTEFAKSLRPLMKATKTPNGETISLADRCGIAAAIRASDPADTDSSQFLIGHANNGETTAYLMLSACQATEAIPTLLERLQQSEKELEIMTLIMALDKMPLDDSAKKEIQLSILKLSLGSQQIVEQRRGFNAKAGTKD